jgi:hypothetical protein
MWPLLAVDLYVQVKIICAISLIEKMRLSFNSCSSQCMYILIVDMTTGRCT